MSKKAAELPKQSAESTMRTPRVTTAKQPSIMRADTTKKPAAKHTPPRGIGGRFEATKSNAAHNGKR